MFFFLGLVIGIDCCAENINNRFFRFGLLKMKGTRAFDVSNSLLALFKIPVAIRIVALPT